MLPKRVLIAEDESKSFEILKRILSNNNWTIESAVNGKEALEKLKQSSYDALLTDLKMPEMDGLELITRVKAEIQPLPLIIMFSGFATPEVRKRAMELGAHDFFIKPIDFKRLYNSLFLGLRKIENQPPKASAPTKPADPSKLPFVAVVIAVSTGGPQTLQEMFRHFPLPFGSPLFLVQHSPSWALESITEHINREFDFDAKLAADGMVPQSNWLYVAPGENHMRIDSKTFKLQITNGPPENFVRPAADPLFRSAADAFGPCCIAVVLTGLGSDGALGAKSVADRGGTVLIQSPESAIAPFMPEAAIETVAKHQVVPLSQMAEAIKKNVIKLSKKLGHRPALSD